MRVDDDTIRVSGTVEYASSECGTVDLAHAEYEASQDRLDVFVVAADGGGGLRGCTDDLVQIGYRLETAVDGRLRRASATEHHVRGDTYSTSADGRFVCSDRADRDQRGDDDTRGQELRNSAASLILSREYPSKRENTSVVQLCVRIGCSAADGVEDRADQTSKTTYASQPPSSDAPASTRSRRISE